MSDLLSKTWAELKKMLDGHQNELFSLRMKNAVRWLKQTHLINDKKKEVARIKWVLNQKKASEK